MLAGDRGGYHVQAVIDAIHRSGDGSGWVRPAGR
jgi:hypothetical protein